MLIAYLCISKSSSMTDSMNFGPEWLRNLSSEGSTAGGSGGGTRYQLADYRYGREEMLALFEKGLRAPNSLSTFSPLYSEPVLPPLALIPQADEERVWQSRSVPPGGIIRGRGGSLERGRISRGRGPYQPYGRGGYDGTGGWGATEPIEWSPRKDYTRNPSVDNWRRNRGGDEDEGWRTSSNHTRGPLEKWGRSTSWRDGGDGGEERGPPERPNRSSWQEGMRGHPHRRPWDSEDHLPEWAMENPSESGGSFDATGAFHGSDDERDQKATHPSKREVPLQKSVSQQNIVTKAHPAILPSSQSAISLSKPPDDNTISEEKQKDLQTSEDNRQINNKHIENAKSENRSINKPMEYDKDPPKKQNSVKKEYTEQNQINDKQNDNSSHSNNTDVNGIQDTDSNNRVEEEFDRLQEDLVKKLVVDEETPKKISLENFSLSGAPPSTLAPPNLAPPVQDKWYYQDPQGDLQGPFLSSEMAEWFRAGYFTSPLLVKRLCDETFYRLGDLVTMCGGNPFQCNMRIAPLKQEVPPAPDGDLLQYQLLQRQLALRQAATMRALNQTEPWGNMSAAMQQRDMVAQQVLAHPQMTPDMQFLQQSQHQQPPTNPLMHMINQMQQANKLSGQTIGEKPPNAVPSQLDPIQALVQQMGGLQSMQNNLQSGSASGLPTTMPSSGGLSGNLQTSGLSTNLSSGGLLNNYQNMPGGMSNSGPLPVPVGLSVSGGMPGSGGLLVSGSGGLHSHSGAGISVNSGMPGSGCLPGNDGLSGNGMPGSGGLTGSGLPVGLQSGLPSGLSDNTSLPPRPNPLGAVDPLSSSNENEAIKSLLRQLANKQQTQQLDSLWQQNQFSSTQPKPQWQQNDVPISMWDIQTPAVATSVPSSLPSDKPIIPPEQLKNQEKERQRQIKENHEREQKKKRELEEKQAKKDAEERRKEEQRKQEIERKAAEEKRKKEEERVRKELERAKKEAEEKRLRELEEKRRLKEQRKAEEEQRRKSDEQKRIEEAEKIKREMKEREDQLRRQAEAARQENIAKISKVAPWSQPNSTPELSLADIQRLEREKRAEQAALLQQQRNQQMLQEQQTTTEKQLISLNWAKKPPETRKVKSLAEIQQEEQDRLMKHAAETRLAQQKEKEATAAVASVVTTTPWSGQNLTWASTASQWSNAGVGFWDEASLQKSPNKPSSVSKSNSTSAVNASKQVVKQNKSKTKKEEQQVMKLFSNGPATDEFTDWCTIALKKLNSTVDIPTFISFLRDIESALEVRDYCREYLGDGPTTQQFAAQFLEKRRMIKPKIATQKDDMSSPAPAITPSTQHCTDFQEVKGKGKKVKKSKMTKVDARILGFSVTAAPDRINVGDRDYVEN